jgi:LacI family transcriptional regulator
MVAKIQHLLSKTNYAPVFAFWETWDEIKKALNHILSRQVDAIITCEPDCIPDDLNIPVVAYRNPDERFDFVGYSGRESTKIILDYLTGLGHRRIAYIGPPNSAVCSRMQEFLKQIKERGLINLPEWNQLQPGTPENVFSMGAASLEKIWSFKEHPTAILTSDSIAIGAIRKAWEMNIKVPEELSIIGFGGTEHAQYCIPGLTTVKLADTNSIVSIILDKVFKRIEDKSLPRSETIINCKLLMRESCAAVTV